MVPLALLKNMDLLVLLLILPRKYDVYKYKKVYCLPQVAGAWSERQKMFHGGSFLKLADDDV